MTKCCVVLKGTAETWHILCGKSFSINKDIWTIVCRRAFTDAALISHEFNLYTYLGICWFQSYFLKKHKLIHSGRY